MTPNSDKPLFMGGLLGGKSDGDAPPAEDNGNDFDDFGGFDDFDCGSNDPPEETMPPGEGQGLLLANRNAPTTGGGLLRNRPAADSDSKPAAKPTTNPYNMGIMGQRPTGGLLMPRNDTAAPTPTTGDQPPPGEAIPATTANPPITNVNTPLFGGFKNSTTANEAKKVLPSNLQTPAHKNTEPPGGVQEPSHQTPVNKNYLEATRTHEQSHRDTFATPVAAEPPKNQANMVTPGAAILFDKNNERPEYSPMGDHNNMLADHTPTTMELTSPNIVQDIDISAFDDLIQSIQDRLAEYDDGRAQYKVDVLEMNLALDMLNAELLQEKMKIMASVSEMEQVHHMALSFVDECDSHLGNVVAP